MFRGLRHTAVCSECGETTKPCITYGELEMVIRNEKSQCCGATFEYVGLQPYRESILKDPGFEGNQLAEAIEKLNKNTEEENKMIEMVTEGIATEGIIAEGIVTGAGAQEVEMATTPVNETQEQEMETQEQEMETQESEIPTNEIESQSNEEQTQDKPVLVTVTSSSGLKIEDIIDTSKKMNKTVMFNALRAAMSEDNEEKVNILKSSYPDFFEGTLQYMPKKFMKRFGIEVKAGA